MTAVTTAAGAVRNRAPSADAERQAAIEQLGRDCEGMPWPAVLDGLARLAHPSLSAKRRADLFGRYWESLDILTNGEKES